MEWLNNLFGGISKGVGGLVGNLFGGNKAPAGTGQSNMLNALGGPNQFMNAGLGGASGVTGQGGTNMMNFLGAPFQKMFGQGQVNPNYGGSGAMNAFLGGPNQFMAGSAGKGNTMNWAPKVGIPTQGVTGTQPEGSGTIQKLLGNMFSGTDMGKMGLGLGINALGQFMAPKVKTPNIMDNAAVQGLQNFDASANMNKQLDPAMLDALNRSIDINQQGEQKKLRDIYKNARPGSDYTTDSAYQSDWADMQRSQTLDRSDAIAQASFQNKGYNLQASQQELAAKQELAMLSVADIMNQTGMSAQEAQQFKQSFSNIGNMFMQKGMYPNDNQYGGVMNMFMPYLMSSLMGGGY